MKTKFIVFVLILSIGLAACAPPGGWEALSSGDNPNGPGSEPLLSGPAQEGDDGSAIDNSGTVYPPGPANSDPGESAGSESGSGDDTAGLPEEEVPVNWIAYTDPNFGFSLQYPDIYTILSEPQNFSDIAPSMIGRWRLLDSSLANSDVADLEPPKFSIEIYANDEGFSLNEWMDANLPGGDKESVEIDGANCTKLTRQALLAPNQFIVCEYGGNMYKFTPLGLYSEEILASFNFGQ
ncbi:MAG: hypothetical protein AB1846_15885 [Chloroflexota bacterium]